MDIEEAGQYIRDLRAKHHNEMSSVRGALQDQIAEMARAGNAMEHLLSSFGGMWVGSAQQTNWASAKKDAEYWGD